MEDKKIFTLETKKAVKLATPLKTKNFHESIRWVIILAQCFGQMPITGISKVDPKLLKFKWKSFRTAHCLLTALCAFTMLLFMVVNFFKHGNNFYYTNSIVFYFSTAIITLLFLKLAREWPKLMRKWNLVDCAMRSYGYHPSMHKRITIMTIVVLALAFVENMMVNAHYISITFTYKCNKSFYEYLMISQYPQIFEVIDFSIWVSIPIQLTNFVTTFAWTFNDLFIMLISTALALRFQQVTSKLRILKKCKTLTSVEIWRDVREDYNRLSKLTRNVDETLSYIILTSYASNLYFVLVQLFNSIRVKRDTIEKIYFFISFGFVILRTFCVSIYGAWIYDESREPIPVLNSIPSEMYNIEIKRFIEQIKFDTVALTGKHFFNLTRGLILSMAGAVVTYELVLIQFNGNVLKESAEEANSSAVIC